MASTLEQPGPARSAMPPGRLHGRIAIITGGTSGIGLATVHMFLREGADVIVSGRRPLADASVQALIGTSPRVVYVRGDVRDADARNRLVDAALSRSGRVDILFNNAGVVLSGSAVTTSEEEWDETMDTNVKAAWALCQLVIPIMRAQRGGVIINNASDWGLVGARNALAYCVSKAALIQLTKCIALETARDGIRANAVCPGDTFVKRWTDDGYFRGSGPVLDAAAARESGEIPMGRVAEADEIARTVLFLASDDSSFMTGSCLVVDGGNTAQ